MTLTKQLKKSTKKKRNNQQVNGEATPVKNRASITEAAILPGIVPVKMSKDPPPSPPPTATLKQEPAGGGKQDTAEPTIGAKLERKPSLRRKLGSLLRGSADLPAAINRGLQPIRRSMSFGKGIEQKPPPQPNPTNAAQPKNSSFKAFRTRSVQWYNSLSSLAENDETKGHLADSEERIFDEDDTKENSPEMESHCYRSWNIAMYWEKLAGFWPYRNKTYNNVVRTCLILLLVSLGVPLGARMVKEFGINFQIAVENIFGMMLCFGVLMKVFVVIKFEDKRKLVYDTVSHHINTIHDPKEIEILREHYDYGLQYSFCYEAIMVILAILFHGFHIAMIILKYFFTESDMINMIPFHLEYFVDEAKYFYYIFIHLAIFYIALFIIIFAFDSAFIMQIQHICALFKIVTMRLENNLKSCGIESNIIIYNGTDMNMEVRDKISSAIKLHLEVIKMVNSIEEIYSVSLFIILVENMAGVGGGLYIIYSYAHHDFFQVGKYSMIFIGTAMHFYVMFTQGQKIIDSSSCVFDACYNCPWYNWNKSLRKMLFIIMARTVRPCEITGGSVFVISMASYWKMMKTGLSCYTVFKMREDFA